MKYRGHLLILEFKLLVMVLLIQEGKGNPDCGEGYMFDENGRCDDENECDFDEDYYPNPCGNNTNCVNTRGSYYCQCLKGFQASRGHVNFTADKPDKCQDINECVIEGKDCGPNATCHNTEGGYTCICVGGFRPSNGKETFLFGEGITCRDINECDKDSYVDCGPNATCQNTEGGYACICRDGFRPSDGNKSFLDRKGITCQDIDECALKSTICGENAKCHNTPGNFYCVCNPGFKVNKKTCEDENECERNGSICGDNAECHNTLGGHYCTCNSGFRLESGQTNFTTIAGSCKDICSMGPNICGAGDCILGRNSYECRCHKGHTNYGFHQEACTALNCSLQKDGPGEPWPELEAIQSLVSGQCDRLGGYQDLNGALSGRALLEKLLSFIDDLLSKRPLQDSKIVSALLSIVETGLKLAGPLLNEPQIKLSSKYVELEMQVMRGASQPTGNLSLFSGRTQLDTHWETAAGDSFAGFATTGLLAFKNLEESTNDYFGVTPEEANQRFQINSKVVTAIVSNANTTLLAKNITLFIPHLKSTGEKPKCVYWDLSERVWSDRGCMVVTSTAKATVCSCNHLSSFAVLMALYEVEDTFELLLMTWVGLSLSVVCLLACVLTFGCCRSIQGTRNTIHLHLSLSLFIATLIFLVGISRTQNQIGCAVVAGLLHFFYLAVFCWMCLEGVQLFRMVVLVFHTTLRPATMLAAGYGPPAIVVAITAMVNAKGYGSKRLCWFDVTQNNMIWSFLGPVCFIIAVNVFFFLITVYKLAEKFSSLNPELKNLQKIKTFTVTAVAQLTILGTMWIFGCFQFNKSTMALTYIFTFLNCLQGVLMFVMHCLLNKQVREEYGKFLSCVFASKKTKYSDFSSNQSKSQMTKSAQNTGESQI